MDIIVQQKHCIYYNLTGLDSTIDNTLTMSFENYHPHKYEKIESITLAGANSPALITTSNITITSKSISKTVII